MDSTVLRAACMKGIPGRRIILAPHVFLFSLQPNGCTCPLHQDSYLRGKKLAKARSQHNVTAAFGRKILVLREANQKWRWVFQWTTTAIKADHFVWRYHELFIVIILVKVQLLTPVEQECRILQFCFCRPSSLISSSLLGHHTDRNFCM